MKITKSIRCIFIAILTLRMGRSQLEDEYSDENRPYKFGFNIQGYQHRQEEKDGKGIIKGEYGFITADGYYRVTVYATDENGDFRIISMKNYYVGFPPEDPTTTPQSPSLSNRAQKPEPRYSSPENQSYLGRKAATIDKQANRGPTELKGLSACSNCLIPTTTKTPSLSTQNAFGNQPGFNQNPTFSGRTRQSDRENTVVNRNNPPLTNQFSDVRKKTPRLLETNKGKADQKFLQKSSFPDAPKSTFSSGNGQTEGGRRGKTPKNKIFMNIGGTKDNIQYNGPSNGRNSFRDDSGRKPNVVTVREGLPKGITMDTIKALLYTFNYTVGFHGHHEDGYRNGDKEGDYFFDGKDGVERKVEYLANEFGYQPNITFIDLPENDARRPNDKTEKEYGLKGYEFKWFYRK